MIRDCVFCKIVNADLPCDKVYEDEDLLVFLDIAPLAPGHALIIPKEHHTSITTVPPTVAGRLMQVAPQVAIALTRAAGADGFNLLLSNGACAGQVVPHAHMHLVPRKADDTIVLPARTAKYESDEQKAEILRKTRERLAK